MTRSTYTTAILMGRGSVFRLRIEQGNKLPFDNINPEDWRHVRIPLGLNKASAFWQYQSMWQAANLDKPNLRCRVSEIPSDNCHWCWLKDRSLTTASSLRTQVVEGPNHSSNISLYKRRLPPTTLTKHPSSQDVHEVEFSIYFNG